MADYNRIYWAIQALGVAREGSHNAATAHVTSAGHVAKLRHSIFTPGIQSVGITTTFNLEQVFEMGQLSIYQDV